MADGNVNEYSHYGGKNSYEGSQKIKNRAIILSSNLSSGYLPKILKTFTCKDNGMIVVCIPLE